MEDSGNYKRELGRLGEDLACRHLESLGHRILTRNWRSGHLEIDIISRDADGIHFVEVKTRRQNIQAPPQYSVDISKQKRIVKAAQAYLRSRKGASARSEECFFDIVAITCTGNSVCTEFIEQAFMPVFI
jgi:putative endonuclease